MAGSKRRVVCSDSGSEDEFQPVKSRPKEKQKSTKQEGEATEDSPYDRPQRRSPKRRKSLFAPDLGDSEAGGLRGKVQLTFEESLKKAAAKKKTEASKAPKNLDFFFSSSKATDQSKKEKKKEIAVDDFFASSTSCKTPKQKESVTLVPETPPSSRGDARAHINDDDKDICLSASSMLGKSLMPSPAGIRKLSVEDSFAAEESPKTPTKKTPATVTPSKKKSGPSTPASVKTKATSSSTNTPKQTPGNRGNPLFWKFQNREGPQALGSRPIPKNTSTCFSGMTFVISGIYECIEREDLQALIERGGGRVTSAVSKRTTYLLVGRDAGTTKVNKATSLGTPQLTEDAFFDLVDRGFGTSSSNNDNKVNNANYDLAASLEPSSTISKKILTPSPPKKAKLKAAGILKEKIEAEAEAKKKKEKTKPEVLLSNRPLISPQTSVSMKMKMEGDQDLWVEKYRPKTRKQLVGQNGPASPANRLYNWLVNWQDDYATGRKAKAYSSAPPWASGGSSDNGEWARAALLSGPPGIGKTTTASVVCSEVGLATIEMNASDTRSKRSLQEEVAEALGMRSLAGCFSGGKAPALTSHVLIMDEVDGMAGNEDRGGMQELISIIKTSKVPIICLCNDRQSPKVRSLANYCLDLRFHRPRAEQIKAAVLSMVHREGVSIGPTALNEIIVASHQDLRQVINSVQMWCMNGDNREKSTASEDDITASAAAARKDNRLGPFDVIRKVFAPHNDGKAVSFSEIMDLFFQDYSIGPLFVQDNYLNVRPLAANGDEQKTLDLLAEAANDISRGDVVARVIQSTGGWSLLPTQAVFSCLRPGRLLKGSLPGGPGSVTFPTWFGRSSTQAKNARLLGELSQHMRLSTHCGASDPRSLLLDYLHPLAVRLTAPLKEGDINKVLECLDAYQLLREDMDNVMDLTTWQGRPAPMKAIDAKVKSALTRSYNKTTHKVPYAMELSTKGGKRKRNKQGDYPTDEAQALEEEAEANQLLGGDSPDSSVEDEEEIMKLAKVKSVSKSTLSTSAPAPASTSKKPSRGRKKKEEK